MELDFYETVKLTPLWVQYWIDILSAIVIGAPIILLFQKETRIDALFIILAVIISTIGVWWIFQQFGYVRLLGFGHIISWTPLCYYLFIRLRKAQDINKLGRITIIILLLAIFISLGFDYTDTIRYILGERDILYP